VLCAVYWSELVEADEEACLTILGPASKSSSH
jgi:hypothetical protein